LPGISVGACKGKIAPKAMWREMAGVNGSYELRETTAAYKPVFDGKKGGLRQKMPSFGVYTYEFQ